MAITKFLRESDSIPGQDVFATDAEMATAVRAGDVGKPGYCVAGQGLFNGSGSFSLTPSAPVSPATGYAVVVMGFYPADANENNAGGYLYYSAYAHAILSQAGASDSGKRFSYIICYY